MIEQALCPNEHCRGRGAYTLGPYPATKCNTCGGKGYIMVEADPIRARAHELHAALRRACESLATFIRESGDPGSEALAALYEGQRLL